MFSLKIFGQTTTERETQHAIELVSGLGLLDSPHHRMDLINPIELKEQVDNLSVENMQQCLVPINTNVYEDKFWNHITNKDVGQVKYVTIYGLPMSENSMNAVMEESHTLQLINFSSIIMR